MKPTRKTCSRGHVFYKSSDCPVCPICWAGYYKDRGKSDLPDIPGPALRALLNEKITTLTKLATRTEQDVLALHGMGPASMPKIKKALRSKGLSFKKEK